VGAHSLDDKKQLSKKAKKGLRRPQNAKYRKGDEGKLGGTAPLVEGLSEKKQKWGENNTPRKERQIGFLSGAKDGVRSTQ